ncbi:TPA: acyltransferase family protein, partial [Escherichia coli]
MRKTITLSGRIYWVDALRFIAMFLVYIGHLGPSAGRIYSFVYLFHVPLFFFISGMFYRNTGTLCDTVRNGFAKLIVPYFTYSLLSLIVYILFLQKDSSQVYPLIIQMLEAKRNFIDYAPQLWFLPCLFIVMLAFKFIHMISNSKLIIVAICSASMVASIYIPRNPVSISPQLPYALDSAGYYVFWYCVGYLLKDVVISFFNEINIYTNSVFICAIFFAGFCFFGLMKPYDTLIVNLLGGKTYALIWTVPTLILFIACVPVAK